MPKHTNLYCNISRRLNKLDFIPLLALRLYLAPVFIMAGWHKLVNFDSMVGWFGNSDWGLGLPFAPILVSLTILAELVGGIALLFGVLTRLFSLMLAFTMVVAMVKVHLKNGWHAITPTDPATSIAQLFSFSDFGHKSLVNSVQAGERLTKAKEVLATYGNYDWLTETGNFVILNNGIEFGMTYFVMLLVLIVFGAGRFLSVDYYGKILLSRRTK